MSIHQPRYSIFKLFDSVTLLSRGEVVYSGPACAVVPYFSSVLGKEKDVVIFVFRSTMFSQAKWDLYFECYNDLLTYVIYNP